MKDGKIVAIVEGYDWHGKPRSQQIIDYGESVVMPGLIDV